MLKVLGPAARSSFFQVLELIISLPSMSLPAFSSRGSCTTATQPPNSCWGLQIYITSTVLAGLLQQGPLYYQHTASRLLLGPTYHTTLSKLKQKKN